MPFFKTKASSATASAPQPENASSETMNCADLSTFDNYYRKTVDKLRSEQDRFTTCTTDLQRTNFLMKVLSKDDLMEAVNNIQGYYKKDDQIAEGSLFEAQIPATNHIKHARNFLNVSTSIRHASGSILLEGVLLRASVLFDMKCFAEVLKDCEYAMKLGDLAQEQIVKVTELKSDALLFVGRRDESIIFINKTINELRESNLPSADKAKYAYILAKQLRYIENYRFVLNDYNKILPASPVPKIYGNENPDLPNASDIIKIKHDDEKGRCVVAQKTIHPGTIIMVDEAYTWCSFPTSWSDHCYKCALPVLSAIPCGSCSAVVYCSIECKEECWNQYHRHECDILEHFVTTKIMSKMAHIAYRIILKAGIDVLKNPGSSMEYKSVYDQETNTKNRKVADLLKRSITAYFLLGCLVKTGYCSFENDGKVVMTALLRHLQSCSCNAYEITEQVVRNYEEERTIGGAVFTSLSKTNHACNNNVARHSVGLKCVVRAIRTIRAGEEVFDNYGFNYLSVDKEDRVKHLSMQYFFNCDCQACKNDWPTYELMKKDEMIWLCSSCGTRTTNNICQKCLTPRIKKAIEKKIKSVSGAFDRAIICLKNNNYKECEKLLAQSISILDDNKLQQPNATYIKMQNAIASSWSRQANVNNVMFPACAYE